MMGKRERRRSWFKRSKEGREERESQWCKSELEEEFVVLVRRRETEREVKGD